VPADTGTPRALYHYYMKSHLLNSLSGVACGLALMALSPLIPKRYGKTLPSPTLYAASAFAEPQFIPLQAAPTQGSSPKAAPTEFTPMDYFADNCARCHGPNGSFYGPTFGQKLTDDQLRQVVKRMADGPGNAPLDDPKLDIETAYHRSLVDKRPFLVLTHIEGIGSATATLTGEVTPDAAVKVTMSDKTVEAKVDDHSWTATVTGDIDWSKTQISAEKEGVKTLLNPAQVAYSHNTPIKAPAP